ncbi:hypothetical protein [Hymenobacter lucidus]|uniref:Uncharacterized protein n=1 Tax=Hymenobacter lucidus TaxID=2880930 RepID=A0ABS8AX01_9BACT|nr:hypothetical protein [Hymenobacter lucidus]MCB2410324.1 hypothetical protein [Hymenobacter lucidus]
MEEMYVGRVLTVAQIQAFLQAVLPELTVFEWSMMVGEDEPMVFDSTNATHIFFETTTSEVPHFPQHLAIYRTPHEDWEARSLWLGQGLSATYAVAVLVPFTHPEQPLDPYYDIIFQNGSSYLADDSQTDFGEPDAKPVRILGAYDLPPATFDASGNLIEAR